MSTVAHRRFVPGASAFAAAFAVLCLSPTAALSITVSTLADSGPGSLREAIAIANSDGVPTAIDFAGGLAGGTIFLLSQLPDLSEGGTTIDGDLGGDCDPDIQIDGSAAGPGADGEAFTSDGNTIRGLAFFDFDGDGLHIGGSDNVVECSYFGTNLALASGHGNGQYGIRHVSGSDNRLGPDNFVLHNGGAGILMTEPETGGYPLFTAMTANDVRRYPVINFEDSCRAFESADAILPTDGGGAPFTENFGLRLTGQLDLGASGDYTFTLPVLDDQARLMIDGNEELNVGGQGPHSTVVTGLASGAHTIELDFHEGGGAAQLELNITGPGSATLSTDSNTGGCSTGQAGLCGELFRLRVPSERNTITQSNIHSNGWVGIALNCCCSPVENDPGDLDLGANTALNHPVITGVVYGGAPGNYTVSGTAPPSSTVELFLSDDDPSGYGDGETYLATLAATGGGTFSGAIALAPGTVLTATATDASGNTSEFGPNFAASSGMDEATVGTNSGLPGATFEIPISVRDLSLTALGRDRPAGEKIQSLSFKVVYSPTGSFSSITAARAGITAALSPAFQSTPSTSSSISYLAQFNETTNLIPFALDAGAPGDQVAKLTVTLAANAPAGSISLTLDTAATSLGNFAGTLEETTANGRLSLTNGSITVLSNAAVGLYAAAESSSTIRLRWADPGQNETGFRLERSTDGSGWSSVTSSIGPNETSYLDTGRAPATLYYYRLVTLIAPSSTSSQISNVGFATTFPASAAKVCVQRLPGNDAIWARVPSVAWNDIDQEWAVVWQGREDGIQDEIWFQRLNSTTLAPIGGPINVSQNAMTSQYPTLIWNGSRFLVAWYDHMRREPGTLPLRIGTFALLEPDGTIVRRGVAPASSSLIAWLNDDAHTALAWDGTNWGFVTMEVPTTFPFADLFYRRLAEDAEVVLGPIALTATPGSWEGPVDVAYNPALGVDGVAWIRKLGSDTEVLFQRFEESTGSPLGSPQTLGALSGSSAPRVLANGADGWVVAWNRIPSDGSEYANYLRKVDASGTPVGGAAERLSDAAPAYDYLPKLHPRPDGGFVVISGGYSPEWTSYYEIVRAEADSSGAKDGPVVRISPDDGVSSYFPTVAGDGDRFLVVWNESDPSGSPNGLEVAGLLVDADGLSAPGPKVDLTTGHTPGSNIWFVAPAPVGVQPLGAGFVALWTDPAHPGEIRGRSWDGSGGAVQDFLPLNSAPLWGGVSFVSVGDTFAVFWRTAPNDFRFARFSASGPILGESGISSASNGVFALGFDGERYAVFIRSGPNFLLRRIDSDGNPVGSEITVPATSGQAPRLLWTGGGWALLWRGSWPDPSLYYMFVAGDGTVVTPATVVAARTAPFAINQFSMAWNGSQLGVAWAEQRTSDTVPGQDIYFTRLNLGGSKAFPEVTAVSTPTRDFNPNLYWADGAFRLIHVAGDRGGFREIAIDPADGTVLPGERYWSNRDGGGAFGWNGVTLGMLWNQVNLRAAHFQTGACVDDPSPPPCPSLSVASVGGFPRLSWPAVADPDSGIWRYQVIRDDLHLAELDSATTQFDDAGFETATTHVYELLAMNGAYQESESCTPVPFSTTAGDANGDGSFEVADLFYLINFYFSDGAPPAGDGDANGDGLVTVADLFYLINHFFSGGPPPV